MVVDSKQLDADESAFRDLLEERVERVDTELREVDSRIAELQERRRDLTDQRGHLVALMGERALSQQPAPDLDASREPGAVGSPSIADRVVALIAEVGKPLHYRDIEREMRARGQVAVGGRDPANTLLSRYFNDPRLFRPSRGTYDLRENGPGEKSVGTRRSS